MAGHRTEQPGRTSTRPVHGEVIHSPRFSSVQWV